ncbi:CobW family GTP-binding protein [Variovorax sp. Root434]|uniref:CobW family GTP-binding protein n=1 Tax=Variovorax sp. Root434 TaxID=1736536 RepID=UPI0006F2E67D|nr:GTP-binding protein [Variovorax sp. Root434]KQX21413.1 cobalamin biosynthesis protein P47K [Variovorax sp. Root434]
MAGHFSSLLTADTQAGDRVPVTVLTGFLGSGKTTLLNRLLQQADLHGMAVIVNEFGEVGIDHDLITQTSDDTILLANGCMCCSVRGDLVAAMQRLGERSVPSVRHVLIETSGLANPAPILRTLMGDAAIRSRFALAGVACTVDAVLGMGTLDRHAESVQQAAIADHLFLTKADLMEDGSPPPELLVRLSEINSVAKLHLARDKQPQALHRLVQSPKENSEISASAMYYRPPQADGRPPRDSEPVHRDGISSFVVERDVPLPRDAFFAWLDMVIAMRGEDLLRVKGLVHLADEPDRPMVVHGVQHLFHPPEFLPAWPGQDRRTRIVFITRGVNGQAMSETLDVLIRRHLRRGPSHAASPSAP